MKILRSYINNAKPNFVGEGKYSKWFPLFDAVENLFFSTQTKTSNPVHVRDAVDIQKVMVTVWLATFPAMFFGMYNLGAHSLEYLESINQMNTGDWHHYLISFVGYDSSSFFSKMWFGASYFLPIYVTVFVVGIGWEALFAIVRKHEINEGAFVSTVLFSLSCPPDLPLWQAAMGITFGLVIGKEIFGGTGKNFLNPALTGRAFLYFAYPSQISGDKVDLSKLPIQTSWPEDAGPLITWPLVITRGPNKQRQNLGIYRQQVIGKNRLIMRWLSHRGGALDFREWKIAHPGENFPIAVALGADPATILGAVTPVPDTLSEYAFAGLLRDSMTALGSRQTNTEYKNNTPTPPHPSPL